jgi:hypothetical protein
MRLAIGQIRSNRRGNSHSGRHTARRAVCAEIMPRIVRRSARKREVDGLALAFPTLLNFVAWVWR